MLEYIWNWISISKDSSIANIINGNNGNNSNNSNNTNIGKS